MNNEKSKNIGQRIREIREKGEITLTDLARRVGISKSHLSAIERGEIENPSFNTVRKIGQELDVSLDQLARKDLKSRKEKVRDLWSFIGFSTPHAGDYETPESLAEEIEDKSELVHAMLDDILTKDFVSDKYKKNLLRILFSVLSTFQDLINKHDN